jgi:hypothetical protein
MVSLDHVYVVRSGHIHHIQAVDIMAILNTLGVNYANLDDHKLTAYIE